MVSERVTIRLRCERIQDFQGQLGQSPEGSSAL
jgi:hypothetical protein